MKLGGGRVDGFIARPDPEARIVLLHGADAGLVRERATALVRTVSPDPADPFRVTRMTAAAALETPARLADEAAAIAFGGGRRAVWITGADNPLAAALRALLDHNPGDALIVVEADTLNASSPLRRLCEDSKQAMALPCYPDDEEALAGVIRQALAAHKLTADRDALDWLVEHLGSDRRLTRSEIEKLALHMGGPGQVTLADAAACVGETSLISLDDLVSSTAEGAHEAAQRALRRLLADGEAPVGLLRVLIRHFQRLNLLAGQVAAGRRPEQAVAELRPKPFFRLEKSLLAQIPLWSQARTADALDLLQAAEADCKTSGLPAEAICGRAVLRLTRAARRPAG